MPKTVVGIIAATLVAAVLGVAGVSSAAASTTNPTLAQQVQQGRDRLAAAWQAQDVAALKAAVSELNPVLATADANRAALSPAAAMYLGRAEQQRDQLATALYATAPQRHPRLGHRPGQRPARLVVQPAQQPARRRWRR
jgi:hypothetical protein